MTTTVGVAIGEYTQWIQSASSELATGIEKASEQIKSGLLSEAKKWEKVAQNYYDQFSKYQQSANALAEKAAASSNPRAADVWNRISDTFEKVGGERAALGDEAWLKKLAVDSNINLAKAGIALGLVIDTAKLADAVIRGDFDDLGHVSAGILGGALLGVLGAAFMPAAVGIVFHVVAVGLFAAGGEWLGATLWDLVSPDIRSEVSDWFLRAQRWVYYRRDPLTFDLDGDGIETVGINPASPILFDYDGDGVKTATGWIAPDDAFLVLDRNGNGTIDNGTELFGDSTPLGAGGTAADGFAALADQDTNADGKISSADARFSQLRLWQDLNQNGISEANELFTLANAGIAAITVAKTENNTVLPNGNVLADLGQYTRADGTTGGLGAATGQLGDVDLREDSFHSQFIDSIPLTPEAQLLPDMHGSGQVRDLQEAASLSAGLTTLLQQYAAAPTRAEQLGQLDMLIEGWSDTSSIPTTATGAYSGHPLTVTFEGVTASSPQYTAWLEKLGVLERFNGRTFRQVPSGTAPVTVDFFTEQMTLLDKSYAALKSSIYDGLALQTRLKPYLDAIALTTDAQGNVILDYTGTTDTFNTRHAQAPGEAVRDLLDLQRLAGTDLTATGWDGYSQLRGWLAEVTTTTDPTLQPTLVAALADFGYLGLRTQGDGTASSEAVIGADSGAVLNGAGGNDLVLGGVGNDLLNGGDGNDLLDGGAGNDVLDGGAGSDTLRGGAGDDTLGGAHGGADYYYGTWNGSTWVGNTYDGGAGNDTLRGGWYADTYLFGLGDGADTIQDQGGTAYNNNNIDTLRFGAGIAAADIAVARAGRDLVFAHQNGADRVTVQDFFQGDDYNLERVEFADGTVWARAQLLTWGLTVTGGEAADTLDGGADYYYGTWNGSTWVGNTYDGGAGNDTLRGGWYADTYLFGLGDGADTIQDQGGTAYNNNNIDTLRFGAGIAAADIAVARAGRDLVFAHQNGADRVTVQDFFQGDDYNLERVEFADGTVITKSNIFVSESGNDTLTGSSYADLIFADGGNDTLMGGGGNDILGGGTGNDTLMGNAGNDTYIYNLGDGSDRIIDFDISPGNLDTLRFGMGIAPDSLTTGTSGNDLLVYVGNDTLTIQNWYLGADYRIERIQFGDGSVYDAAWLESLSRHAPELIAPLPDQSASEDNPFSLELSGAFSDADLGRGDYLSFSAALADSTALSDWLNIDPLTGTLTGLAGNALVGSHDIIVTATDTDGQSVSDTFTLTVNNTNDAPVVAQAIGDQATDEDAPFAFALPAGVFADDDAIHGDRLTLSAAMADGNVLPAWLIFDAATGTFTGAPDNWDVGNYEIRVTATDAAGTSADDVFLLTVNNINDVPIIANSFVDQSTDEDSPYAFILSDIFTDDDLIHGDSLELSASLADGSILPTWLSFNTTTSTFSGTPNNWQVGSYDIQVTATDLAGTSASDAFTLTVNNVNDNPVLANALGYLTTDEDAPFSFTVPSNTFFDDDFIHGDALTLSATLADGSVLPDWLTFDVTTGSFTGIPDNCDVGSYEVRVTATDTAGTSVFDDFILAVNNTNDAPVLANAIPDQLATEGMAFSHILASDTFHDDDAIHGDVLTYEASLSDGSVLPSWLTFDTTTQTLTGTAPADSVLVGTDGNDVLVDTDTGISGTWDINVTATDTAGVSAEDSFTLTLQGVAGNDTLNGGKGNDVLNGGGGNDTYLYNLGDGLDTLTDGQGTDTVAFGSGITFENTVIRASAGIAHLRLLDSCGNETNQGMDIAFNGNGTSPIETFAFQNGSSHTLADLTITAQTWYGDKKANTIITGRHDDTIYAGKGGDSVYTGTGNDTLYGEKGNDKLYGEGGNDRLYGGKGDDLLNGGCGDDTLDGGQGHNTLIGGKGNDTLILGDDGENTIHFNQGDGWDTLKTATKDEGHDNEVRFGQGITQNNLWFSRSGNNLQVNILGTQTGMTIEGWYNNKHRPIEEFKTANGYELEDKQVALLVQAMAAFSPVPGSGNALPTEMPESLQPVLAAAWDN